MIKRMYKIGRSHYPFDLFHTVVRRGVKLNEGSLNILSGAVQRWVQVGTSITETLHEALCLSVVTVLRTKGAALPFAFVKVLQERCGRGVTERGVRDH